jgi:hypothetical protein
MRSLPPLTSDPLYRMAGADDYDPAGIDAVVYADRAGGDGECLRTRP